MTRTLRWPTILAALLLWGTVSRAQEPGAAALSPQPPTDYFTRRLAQLEQRLAGEVDSPRAAATLYELAEIEPELPNLASLASTLGDLAGNRRALPDVRALARWTLVKVDVDRGRVPQARAQLSRLGFLDAGWLVGGFDNDGGNGQDAVYPPESLPIDLRASYAGKDRQVSWRPVPPLGLDGHVPVGNVVRPRASSTTYFLTQLDSAAVQQAVFHLGASGASKLWVNGELAFTDPDDHPARFDQHAVEVALQRGENVVLFKVSTLAETPSFFLRVTQPNGSPLPRLKATAPAAGQPVTISAPSRTASDEKLTRVADVTAQLEKLVEAHPDDGAIRSDYAMVLVGRRPFDTKSQLARREQRKAAELLGTNARAWLELAGLIQDDPNRQREALEKALAADPRFAPARTWLGLYDERLGFSQRARAELMRAAQDDPGYAPAASALEEALEGLGLDGQANHLASTLAGEFPTTPRAVLGAARADESLGRTAEAIDRYRVELALRWDDEQARRAIASLEAQRGNVAGAESELRTALSLHPTSIGTGLRLAHLYSANEEGARAVEVYDRLAALAPDDAQVFEARGRHELKVGRTAHAQADFAKALALRPQNPALRELVRALEPRDEDYAQPYLLDPVKLAQAEKDRPAGPDDDAVVLANVTVVRVYPNGLSSRVVQQVVRVVDDHGVDQERFQSVGYTPGEQEIKVLRARIIKPDGTVIDAKDENDRRVTDSWAGEYFDRRELDVWFPNLAPGDVVEWTYRLDDVSQENQYANYFGDLVYLRGSHARRDVDYVLIAPKDRKFYTNEPALAGVRRTVTDGADATRVWRWEARDVPKIDPEPKMPGWADVAAYLHVSTFQDWNQVARFWWGLVHDQLEVTPEVAKAADDAVQGIPARDVAGRVRAIYDFVVTQTRYVGLEFGIHGFKPYKVDQILARGFGDCKDKASLMYAMLHHLGIRSELVLLRMHFLGSIGQEPASLAVFNHAILYVPALHRFLDGTAAFSGSTELPQVDQGAQVLVVDPDSKTGGRFFTTPFSRPEDNLTTTTATITLAQDGSARLSGTSHIVGQRAQAFRRYYESPDDRRQRFEQGFSQSYPGVEAVSFTLTDPKDIERPVDTSYVLRVPALGHPSGDVLVFSPFGEPSHFVQRFATLSTRKFPVDLGTPWRNQFDYTIALPKGMSAADKPSVLTEKTLFGSFLYETRVTPAGLKVTGYTELSATSVSPAQYQAFRSFLGDLDRTISHRLRLKPLAAQAQAKR